MKLKWRTLSPVHVGTGEELVPLEYVVYDGKFYRLSQEDILAFAKKEMGEKDGPRAFADWISGEYHDMRDIRDNRELSQREDRLNAYHFAKAQHKEAAFVTGLQGGGFAPPGVPVILDERAKRRLRGGREVALGRVRSAIKTAAGQPYLPGSSIKGSLRTAVFYHFLHQHAHKARLDELIRDQLSKRRRKERFGLPLEELAFYCAAKDSYSGRLKTNDEKMDLFKLVRITDSFLSTSDQTLQLAKVNIYLVEKQGQRGNTYWAATQQRQTTYCEIIPKGNIVEMEIDFDIDFLLRAKDWLKEGGIPAKQGVQWIGLEKKVKELFGLELATLTEDNKEAKKEAVLQHLLQCWQRFSRRQLQSHRDWLDHFSKNDQRDTFSSKVERGFEPIFEHQQDTLIHMGYATGFQGTTALLYFMEDAQMKDLYKSVLENYKVGNNPRNRGQFKLNIDRFPKSRRLVEDEQVIYPMGWLVAVGADAKPTVEAQKMESRPATTTTAQAVSQKPPEPPKPTGPQYFEGKVNYKKPPTLDAVVVKPGRPNVVKVYLYEDNSPEMKLMGYRNPIDKGTLLEVDTQFTKKGKLIQVRFSKLK